MISNCIFFIPQPLHILFPPPPPLTGKPTFRRRRTSPSSSFFPIPPLPPPMALKTAAIPTVEIASIDQVHDPISTNISASKPSRFTVIGHRGNGMNSSSSSSSSTTRENSILSFNQAAQFSIQFIEFDVQVTKDGVPVIFHDLFILTGDTTTSVTDRRVTDLTVTEFLSYNSPEKPLLRRTSDGKVYKWAVDSDDKLCTLQEAFDRVDPGLGFNIELKFDDDMIYTEEDLVRSVEIVMRTVSSSNNGGGRIRSVFFSTFQPDAAVIARRLQREYPVMFLTDGGMKVFEDVRRNTLEEAVKLCVENGLDGIVSEVRGVLRNPGAVAEVKKERLKLMTYGGLNNMGEVVYMEYMMGIDGVIVDRVKEVSDAVVGFEGREGGRPSFTEAQLGYLMQLIAELVKL